MKKLYTGKMCVQHYLEIVVVPPWGVRKSDFRGIASDQRVSVALLRGRSSVNNDSFVGERELIT